MQHVFKKIAYFGADQTAKTLRRPWRLIFIPLRYAVRYTALLAMRLGIPRRWIPKAVRYPAAQSRFWRADILLKENRPEESWNEFKECLKFTDHRYHYTVAAVCLYAGLGRMQQALKLYRKSNNLRWPHDRGVSSIEHERYCLIDDFWTAHIGHAAQIDYVVKLRMLEGRDQNDTILYLPPGSNVANQFLVEQWRNHLRLITDARELPFPESHAKNIALDFYVPEVIGAEGYYLWELAAQTYRRWAAQGRGPVLQLSEDVQDRGRKLLESAGVPPDAWFVGLHVREPQFQNHHRGLHNVLNAHFDDYLPAIEEIRRRGGWVIRMGDPLMTRLQPQPNVLDYCHSTIRSDWMDIFLAGASRFFIGTSSGVCYVAQDYGIPCVLTNWWPPAQRPWHSEDIFVPKLLRKLRNGNILSLEQSLNEPFGYCNSVKYLEERHEVIVQDNEPEDIRAAVVEMLERMGGQTNYDQIDLARRERAEEIYSSVAMRLYDSSGAFGAGLLARDFLRRHPSFVEA